MPRRLLIAACLLAISLAAAPTADAARKVPNGFFGTVFDGPIKSAAPTLIDAEFGRMTSAGVQSARTNFAWGDIQPARGTTTFATTDVLVRAAAEHRQILLPVVTSAPRWARKYPAKAGSPPKRVSDYTALLTALVDRYGPKGSFWTDNPTVPKRPIRNWQIWNEPNLPYQWARPGGQGFKKVAPAYAKLLKASRKTLRKADRGSKVVLAALTNFSWKDLATLYKYGHIRGAFDVAAVNAYSSRASDFIKIADAVRKVLRRNGARKVPIWFTEFTAPAAKGRVTVPVYQRRFITTDAQMAKVVKATYTAFATKGRRLGIQRAYWYTWASTYQKGHPLGFFEFAGLRRFTGGPPSDRPAVSAYRRVARKYAG
jgi:polysaccharide biosynthesis protein PslG